MKVGTPTVDANGVATYSVSSVYQGWMAQTIRVLKPTNPAAGQFPKILFVLPIDAGVDTTSSPYSDGLEELRLLDVQDKYNMTLIAPSFTYMPWYGDNPSDATRRMESFIIDDVVPFGDSFVQSSVPQNYLIGFSKSGNGVLFLMLKHPGVFNAGAAWDSPAQTSSLSTFSPDLFINFGTQANYNLYNIPSLVSTNAGSFLSQNRFWISGDDASYSSDMDQLDTQMTTAGILHTWVAATGTPPPHTWNSGWLTGAVAALDQNAMLTAPAADMLAPPRTGGLPFGALVSGTTQVTLTLNTDDNATCRYSTSAGTAYSGMLNTFLTTGGTAHSTPLTGLQDGGKYTYYVRCQDISTGTVNTDDYAISFSVALAPGETGATASSGFIGTEAPLSENGLWDAPGSWTPLQKNNGAYSTNNSSAARLTIPVTDPDQFAEITFDQDPGAESWVGVTTRVQGPGNGSNYLAIANNGQVQLFRTDDNVGLNFTLMSSASADLSVAPRDLRLESMGNLLRVYFNGVLKIEYTDPSNTYPSGQPGIAAAVYGGPTVNITSFNGGALSPMAATPTFSVPAGTYTTIQTVTISDTTPGATIYYTTDGTTPTTNSSVYGAPIQVLSTETLKANAAASGYSTSLVASATYTMQLPPAATPTFSVSAGTYTSAQTVAISDTTAGATIYYTTDGSTPTTSSLVYSTPITASSTETINAIAAGNGYSSSSVASATYTIQLPAATPTFSVPAGTYASMQTVAISDTTPGVTIYYTTNGSTPTTSSPVYSAPIQVSSTETINAVAAGNGYSSSSVASATYTIQLPAATPTFSVPAGTYTSTQTVAISDPTAGVTIYYTTDGSTPTTSSRVYSAPIPVPSTMTLDAIAAGNGYSSSTVASATYTIQLPIAATPTFSVPGGTYTATQTVTISDAIPGAAIYYTTDGSTPTTSSAAYSAAITVSSTETIQAIALATGYLASAVASAKYTIQPPASFTLTASPNALTMTPGGQGTVTLSVAPQNGFNSAVNFSCAGLPAGTSCSFSPSTVVPSGSTAATSTLTISASTEASVVPEDGGRRISELAFAGLICLFGLRRRRSLQFLVVLAVLSAGMLTGCGGSVQKTNGGSTPVNATVTVTASSGTIQQTATVSLIVN